MKFSYTHHMPYTEVAAQGQDWPIANKQFDRRRGAEMYRAYIDNKVFAEDAGFDWIASNEHHMSPYGLMPNPNLIGACVAERTRTARILQSGVIIPLANPIRVAEEGVATMRFIRAAVTSTRNQSAWTRLAGIED